MKWISWNIFRSFKLSRYDIKAKYVTKAPQKVFWANYLCEIKNVKATGRYLQSKFVEYNMFEFPDDMRNGHLALFHKELPEKTIFLFNNGTFAHWNLDVDEIFKMKDLIFKYNPLSVLEKSSEIFSNVDDYMAYCNTHGPSRIEPDFVFLKKPTTDLEHKQYLLEQFSVSEALCLSVKLDLYERQFEALIPWIEQNMGAQLKEKSGLIEGVKNTLKFYYQNLKAKKDHIKLKRILDIQRELTMNHSLTDLPDHYWDRPDLEVLFISSKNNLDISHRINNLQEKIDLCLSNEKSIENERTSQKSIFLSIIIIILIITDILLEVHSKFLAKKKSE